MSEREEPKTLLRKRPYVPEINRGISVKSQSLVKILEYHEELRVLKKYEVVK